MEPALHLGKGRGSGSRNQPLVQAEQEQEHATDQVEMGVRGPEREVLLDAHGAAGEHPDQQNTALRHIISDAIIGVFLFRLAG